MASITSTSGSIASQPQWFQNYLQQLVGGAAKTASQPYVPYTNARIAGFTPAQQQAFSATEGNVGSYQPQFNAANAAYTGGASTGQLNQPSFNSFMNPYTSDVVNQIQTLGNRNLTENVLPAVNSTFTGAGQFGGSRNADFTNRALRDNQEAISQAQGQALAGGFQNQVQNSQNAQAQQLQAGQLEQGLGTAKQAAGLTDASALSAIGQQQQNQNQSNENLAYQDFLTQQQWPYQQESYLSGILGGSPVPTTTQSTQSTPGPSTTSQVLGGLAGAAGLLGSTGAFNSVGSGISNFLGGLFAEGGAVADDDTMSPEASAAMAQYRRDVDTMGEEAAHQKLMQDVAKTQAETSRLLARSKAALDPGSSYAGGGEFSDGMDGGTPQGGTGVSGWQSDLPGTPFAKGGAADPNDPDQRELADRWMQFRQMMGYQQPTPPASGADAAPLINLYAKGGGVAGQISRLAFGGQPGGISAPSTPVTPASTVPRPPAARAPAIRSRRPRFGGIASRRIGGIGMNPGAGVSGILPGAPAGIGGRMPGAMSPGASSIIRGLSGAATPTARVV